MSNQLCQLASDWGGSLPAGGCLSEQKFNGWRCLYFTGIDNQPRLWTRNGIPLEGASHVFTRLQAMEAAAGEPMFFDGEIVVDGPDTLAATKAWFESGWKRGGDAGVFYAFDCLTMAEWRAGGSDMPLLDRKTRLKALYDASEPDADEWTWPEGSRGAAPPTSLVMVKDQWVFDERDVMAEAGRVWAAGGEGIVLKDPLAPYRRLRTSDWLKVKMANSHKWMRRAA